MNISNVKGNLDNGLPIRPLFVYVNYKAELNKQSKPLFLIKQYKINKFMLQNHTKLSKKSSLLVVNSMLLFWAIHFSGSGRLSMGNWRILRQFLGLLMRSIPLDGPLLKHGKNKIALWLSFIIKPQISTTPSCWHYNSKPTTSSQLCITN